MGGNREAFCTSFMEQHPRLVALKQKPFEYTNSLTVMTVSICRVRAHVMSGAAHQSSRYAERKGRHTVWV